MNYNSSLSSIFFSIILVNALGYFLRYFQYNTYFILFGFRFHISLFLPLIMILKREQRTFFKQIITDPAFKGKFLPLLWILIPLALLSVSPFITGIIKEGDPEHFYEFGLSSMFDYPLYLIWNLPQLALLFLFLASASAGRKNKFLLIIIFLFFLFLFEFLPLKSGTAAEINYLDLSALILLSFICSMLITFFENIYWFSVSIFSILWLYFLALGSKSPEIINILFASRYTLWEGFLTADKSVAPYLLIAYLLLIIIVVFAAVPLRKTREDGLQLPEKENVSQIPGIS